MENRGKLKAMFIIPSAIGVILFMIPVKNSGRRVDGHGQDHRGHVLPVRSVDSCRF